MGFDTDHVTKILQEESFEILSMEQDPDTDILVLTMVHDLHPDNQFTVSLVSKDEEGNDVMNMQFDGPDEYTETEAKQVLQEVMDTLVVIIEKALDNDIINQEPDAPTEEDS